MSTKQWFYIQKNTQKMCIYILETVTEIHDMSPYGVYDIRMYRMYTLSTAADAVTHSGGGEIKNKGIVLYMSLGGHYI